VIENLERLTENYDKLENQNYLLNEKLSDNPFFKNNGKQILNQLTNSGNSEGEELSNSLKNLEKKLVKKFDSFDEKNKMQDDEMSRIRNEIFNFKNGSENNKNLDIYKTQLDSYDFRINEIINTIRIIDQNKVSLVSYENSMKIYTNNYEKKIEEYFLNFYQF